MSFISVLKKIGKGALPIVNTVLGLGGSVMQLTLPQTPGVVTAESEFEKIGGLVKTAEAVGEQIRAQLGSVPNTGGKLDVSLAKATALLPSVKSIILSSNAFVGHQVVDADRFNQGAQKILDGIVDVYDSVDLAKPLLSSTSAQSGVGGSIPAKPA